VSKTLFLLSKTFPFGKGEQYIENELSFLANDFDKIIIYPTDWFGKEEKHNKKLPLNTEVLNFNALLDSTLKSSADNLFALQLVANELAHSSAFSKEAGRAKYLLQIAKHQIYTARNFGKHLKDNFKGQETFFYCYWAHNSCILMAILKMRNIIRHFVTRGHSIDLYNHEWGLAQSLKVPPFEYTRFKYADRIFTVSKHGLTFFSKKYPKWKNKADCSYLGVSDTGVNTLGGEIFTIVTCSNLTANKRMLELAKAIKEIDFPLQWIHFGEGEQRKDIETITSDLSAMKKIRMKGSTPNEEVRSYLKNNPVNLFINLSIVEGLPVSIMEALSVGIPIIATAVYGNPEIVTENTGLLLAPRFTTSELIAAIKSIQSNKNLQTKLSQGAREHYLKNFNDKENYSAFNKQLLNYPNKIN